MLTTVRQQMICIIAPDWSGGLPDSAWNTDRAMAGSMTDRAMAGSMTDKNMTERNMSYDIEGSDEEH